MLLYIFYLLIIILMKSLTYLIDDLIDVLIDVLIESFKRKDR